MKNLGCREAVHARAGVPVRRRKLGALLLATALGLWVTAPRAYTMSVIEIGPNLFQSILNQLNTYQQRYQDYAEYAQQARRWVQTYQHMRQQLFTLQAFVGQMHGKGVLLEERDETYGIEDCDPQGGSLASIALSWLKADLDGEIGPQQVNVCRQIVVTRNKKFNETIKILKHLQKVEAEWRLIEARRLLSNTQGNIEGSNNDVNRFVGRLQQDLQFWQASMAAYDAYLDLLNQEQQRLAQAAMRGKKAVLGTVAQGATLRMALQKARRRER
jgi:hypothetical protein